MGRGLCGSGGGTLWGSYFPILLLLLCSLWKTVRSDSIPASSKYKEVVNVIGSVGQVPCPITNFEDVVMILWFRGSSGAPIYSYDARNEEIEPRHMTLNDGWGLRLYFRVWPNNRRYPALMIQDLKSGDGGLYRCRVDYRNSPTTNSVTRLKIIEPPTRLEVRDTSPSRPISDQQMMMAGNKHSDPSLTYMGPYTEGQNVTLVCSAYGGKPLPEVRWYKNDDLVDTSYSLSGTEYAINEMTISNLGRTHTYDLYSCQANNNNETQALTHKVQLDIYLGVTSVELDVPSPMTAGSEYNLVCKTMGAYPTVKVEFWKNLKRIASRSQMKSVADNMTITSILYKPEVSDDDSTIICKAENPWVSRKPSVARKTMKIKYAPVAVLRLGRNRTTALSEGESVLMECHVKANPPAHTILWFHQGQQLYGSNDTIGLRINSGTLFISYLSHHVGGDYNCEAVNDVGKGISNTLPIVLHLSPKCVSSEAARVPLGVGETQWLTCNILAWPSDLNFYWTLNRSDSTSNGEIRSLSRNLTEHPLPISTMARGMSNVTTKGLPTSNSNSTFHEGVGMVEQRHENQNGYPQLSSGSPSESLDYPEDQHMPHVPETYGTDISSSLKETGSSGKNILFEKKHSGGEKAISGKKKEEEKSSTRHSSANLILSPSTRDAPSSDSYKLNNRSLSKLSTAQPSSSGGTDDKETKSKRHVYPSSSYFSMNGKSRELGLSGFQDRIRHTSLISYQVRSDEDYGTVACWATNSFGSQVSPCLFHIIKKEDIAPRQNNNRRHKSTSKINSNNKAEKEHGPRSGNLTASPEAEILSGMAGPGSSSSDSQRGFSKLQKTLGIVLLFILIFIAGLAGLAFAMLFVLAKRRREIRRIVISGGRPSPGLTRISRRRSSGSSSNSTNKNGKGGLHKNLSENTRGSEEAPTFHSTDMAATAIPLSNKIDPFREIAVETNKGEPQLSYILTDTATTSAPPANKDTFANNIEVGEGAQLLSSTEAFLYLQDGKGTDMSKPLKFLDEDEGKEEMDRFQSMTPRAVELLASGFSRNEQVQRDGACSNGDGIRSSSEAKNDRTGEYCSHLDKDCLL